MQEKKTPNSEVASPPCSDCVESLHTGERPPPTNSLRWLSAGRPSSLPGCVGRVDGRVAAVLQHFANRGRVQELVPQGFVVNVGRDAADDGGGFGERTLRGFVSAGLATQVSERGPGFPRDHGHWKIFQYGDRF